MTVPNRDKEREKIVKMVKKEKSIMGKKSRASGKAFETKVRKDLVSQGYIVCRFDNNVDLEKGECVQAKAKFNPFTRSVMNISSGFPDFVAYRPINNCGVIHWRVLFVESKMTGKLDKKEKEKAKWYLDNNYCKRFIIASKEKVKNKINVIYTDLKS